MRAKEFMKYCPHCGSNSFKGVGDKEMRCSNCDFRFFPNAAAAVALIVTNGRGEILLTRRAVEPNKGTLDLPGGFVDPDESVEEAIKREIKEELGAEVMTMEYLTSGHNAYLFSGYTVMTCDLGFKITLDRYDNLTAQDDISALEWHTPETIETAMSEIKAESIKQIVRYYVTHI